MKGKVKSLRNIYGSSQSVFRYYDVVREEEFRREFPDWDPNFFNLPSLSPTDFFDHINGGGGDTGSEFNYFYYSGEVGGDLAGLEGDVGNLWGEDVEDVEKILWMGHSQVTSSPHHDAVHNLYVQIEGMKEVVLAPPGKVPSFPFVHPYSRQSSPLSLHPTTTQTTDSPPPCFSTTLHPGDILFIPPFWVHQFTATTDPTISLSLWKTSYFQTTFDQLLNLPLPLEQDWGQGQISETFLYLFSNLIIDSPPLWRKVVGELKRRDESMKIVDTEPTPSCSVKPPKFLSTTTTSVSHEVSNIPYLDWMGIQAIKHRNLLKEIENPAIKLIKTTDLVEQWAWALGIVDYTSDETIYQMYKAYCKE